MNLKPDIVYKNVFEEYTTFILISEIKKNQFAIYHCNSLNDSFFTLSAKTQEIAKRLRSFNDIVEILGNIELIDVGEYNHKTMPHIMNGYEVVIIDKEYSNKIIKGAESGIVKVEFE